MLNNIPETQWQSSMVKWLIAALGGEMANNHVRRWERERKSRQRQFDRIRKKKRARILTFGVNINDGFFVGNELMKLSVSLILYYQRIFHRYKDNEMNRFINQPLLIDLTSIIWKSKSLRRLNQFSNTDKKSVDNI